MAPCMANNKLNEKWELTAGGLLRQKSLNVCLDHENLTPQSHVFARKCDEASETQNWAFSH